MTDIIDGLRSATPDPTKTREAIDSLKHKIDRIRMEIQKEQVSKEGQHKNFATFSSLFHMDKPHNGPIYGRRCNNRACVFIVLVVAMNGSRFTPNWMSIR